MVHGGDFLHPNILLQGVIEADTKFKRVNMKEAGLVSELTEEHLGWWKPLPEGMYKVNWDVDVDKANRWLGIGFIVRDYNDVVIAVRSLSKTGNSKPIAAEALTAFHAVEFSKELGLQHIILEGDALQVVTA